MERKYIYKGLNENFSYEQSNRLDSEYPDQEGYLNIRIIHATLVYLSVG